MKKLNEEIASKQRKTQERGITLIALVIAEIKRTNWTYHKKKR